MANLEKLGECVIRGHVDANCPYPPDMKGEPGVVEYVQEAIDEGMKASDILNQGLLKGMEEVGRRFRENEYFVPDVLISAKAMKTGSEMLKPLLDEGDSSSAGTVILGTVQGDLHDIGKNLVGMMLEGAGFNVIDVGVDVAPEKFVQSVKDNPKATIVALSALLTTTMTNMKGTIDALRAENEKLKVIVGGAPVTQEYADEIGADGYAPDASRAAETAKSLVGA